MYKLYYSPGACSMAVHVLLNELGVPFEPLRVALKDGATKTPEYLKLNPRGQVPLLIVDGTPVKEGGAIIAFLLDAHKSPMLPASGIARAKALEWLAWANATLHPAYSRAFWLARVGIDDKAKQELQQQTWKQIQSLWDEAEARLAQDKYLAGDTWGAADILMAVIANWDVGHRFTLGPNVQRVIRETIARPSWQKASATEQVEYKAVA